MGAEPAGELLALDVVEQELRRWLDMHAAAQALFTQLPDDAQAAIRRDGSPSIMHLAMLVGTRPEVRELAETILRQVLAASEHVREAGAPVVVSAEGWVVGRLSHPLSTVPDAEKTDARIGATVVEVERIAAMEQRVDKLAGDVAELSRLLQSVEALLREVRSTDRQPLEPR